MDTLKKNFIDALTEAKGIISKACTTSNQARSTVYKWINEDVEFKAAVDDVKDVALDFVEGKLFDLVEKMDTTAIIFYLKTQGKKRGYIEKHIEEEQPPVIISVNVTKAETVEIGTALMNEVFGKAS